VLAVLRRSFNLRARVLALRVQKVLQTAAVRWRISRVRQYLCTSKASNVAVLHVCSAFLLVKQVPCLMSHSDTTTSLQ
jgi:hypothetical protein